MPIEPVTSLPYQDKIYLLRCEQGVLYSVGHRIRIRPLICP